MANPRTNVRTAAVMPHMAVAPTGDGTDTMRVVEDRPPPPAAARMWTIRPGDHFWHVAEAVLVADWGRPAGDAEIATYWRTLVDHNRSRLVDPGNPDLVYAGQEVELPSPPSPSPGSGSVAGR
jgi:hypothetical protein